MILESFTTASTIIPMLRNFFHSTPRSTLLFDIVLFIYQLMLVCLFLHRAIKFTSRIAYDNAQRALTRAGRVYNLEKVICFFLINGIVIFVFGKGKFSSLVLITFYGCIADSAYRVGCCASKFLWWKNCKSIFSFPILVICLAFELIKHHGSICPGTSSLFLLESCRPKTGVCASLAD